MNKVWLASLFAAGVLSSCLSNGPMTDTASFVNSVSIEGSELPYTVLRDDLTDGKTDQPFEIRNGGYGSAMTGHPTQVNQFYALTDRGPNANYTGDYGKGKSFPVASYTPRIGLFEINSKGEIKQLKTILLKRPDGSLISGLPNTSALGGTGETPYHADGALVVVDDSKPYDETSNPIKLDDYGLDGEGLVALEDGTFWVSDEYGPHMVHFDNQGVEIGRINAFASDERTQFNLPAVYQHRRANRGMEGLAVTPNQAFLVGIMQSTMANPNSAAQKADITRIVTINVNNGETEQYLYRQEKAQNSNSEITALNADEFLVIERDGSFLLGGPTAANPNAQKQVYRIDLTTGTPLSMIAESSNIKRDANHGLMIEGLTLEQYVLTHGWAALAQYGIQPVNKTLIVDMVDEVAYPHDKMEGLWVIDDNHLGVINDDDFATWSTGGTLEQKRLGNGQADANRLYIIEADLMGN